MRTEFRMLAFGFTLGLACLSPSAVVKAVDDLADIKTIRSLPRNQIELESAHRRSASDACEAIGQSEVLETTNFTPILTNRDRRESSRTKLIPAVRQAIFSVGLTISPADRSKLPMISRGQITDYLAKNYVIIEARVRRDLLDRKLYFHHRPIAVTAQYRGSKLSQKFEKVVSDNIREFHSLGLFTKQKERLKPEDLRTLVLLFKNAFVESAIGRPRERFEFAFVCGRDGKLPHHLDIHSFVTTEDRTFLHYLNAYLPPTSSSLCSILGSVVITDFDATGIYPKESVTKSYLLDTRRKFTMSQLDEYCSEHKLTGGFIENVDVVLNAIIDGQITPPTTIGAQP